MSIRLSSAQKDTVNISQHQSTKMWLWTGAKIHWEIAGCVPKAKADDSAWIFDELHEFKGWNSRGWMFLEAEGVKRQENDRKYKPKKDLLTMYELLRRNTIFWGQSVNGGCPTQPKVVRGDCPINKQVHSVRREVRSMSKYVFHSNLTGLTIRFCGVSMAIPGTLQAFQQCVGPWHLQ